MHDLLALATVRRMLLEMGFAVLPEKADSHVGALTLWINQPRDDLQGQTPMQALATPGGEAAVLASLRTMVSSFSDGVATERCAFSSGQQGEPQPVAVDQGGMGVTALDSWNSSCQVKASVETRT